MSGSLSYIYETPGPRARRRTLVGSVISVLALAALIAGALYEFGVNGQLAADRWAPFLQWAIWKYLLVGLGGTLRAAALVAALSAVFGVLLALGRLSRVLVIRGVARAVVEFGRTVPVLLLIYLMLFGLPSYGINLPLLWKLVVPLTVSNSAAFAEIVRAGVLSLPRGQAEAALSLGMRLTQVNRLVVLPQALRAVAPSSVTQLVSLLKDTSLGYVVAYTELLYRAQVLSAYNRLLVQTFLVVTLIYLICNGALSGLASRLQAAPRRGRTTPRSPGQLAATQELNELHG